MKTWCCLLSVYIWSTVTLIVEGKITCECTTLDCEAEGKHTCDADYFCYVETMGPDVTRGCINHKSPLLCENRKPAKLSSHADENWPLLFCCKDEDFCNRDILPVKPTEEGKIPEKEDYTEEEIDDTNNPYVRHEYEREKPPCNNNGNDNSRLNPIYIAVPVAGVCVLLALIIFAMYLLRRRNDFYSNYEAYRYHEQVARLANQQNEAKQQGCDANLNRCTDSERSSQGSETKLFLNA